MTTYTCAQLDHNVCVSWVEQSPSLLDELAITKEDAGAIALAICSLLVLAYVGGLIGRVMLDV